MSSILHAFCPNISEKSVRRVLFHTRAHTHTQHTQGTYDSPHTAFFCCYSFQFFFLSEPVQYALRSSSFSLFESHARFRLDFLRRVSHQATTSFGQRRLSAECNYKVSQSVARTVIPSLAHVCKTCLLLNGPNRLITRGATCVET